MTIEEATGESSPPFTNPDDPCGQFEFLATRPEDYAYQSWPALLPPYTSLFANPGDPRGSFEYLTTRAEDYAHQSGPTLLPPYISPFDDLFSGLRSNEQCDMIRDEYLAPQHVPGQFRAYGHPSAAGFTEAAIDARNYVAYGGNVAYRGYRDPTDAPSADAEKKTTHESIRNESAADRDGLRSPSPPTHGPYSRIPGGLESNVAIIGIYTEQEREKSTSFAECCCMTSMFVAAVVVVAFFIMACLFYNQKNAVVDAAEKNAAFAEECKALGGAVTSFMLGGKTGSVCQQALMNGRG